MLWTVVDVLAFIVALAIVIVGFPGRKARIWRRRFLERAQRHGHSNASPRRDSSSIP